MQLNENDFSQIKELVSENEAGSEITLYYSLQEELEIPNAEKGKKKRRFAMPQIEYKNIDDFLSWAKKEYGLMFNSKKDDPKKYIPTQQDFNEDKVNAIAEKKLYLNKKCLVSGDGYILDGHHRWLAAAQNDDKLPVIILRAPYEECLAIMKYYPKSFKKRINEEGDVKTLGELLDVLDESQEHVDELMERVGPENLFSLIFPELDRFLNRKLNDTTYRKAVKYYLALNKKNNKTPKENLTLAARDAGLDPRNLKKLIADMAAKAEVPSYLALESELVGMFEDDDDPCWDDHEMIGKKTKDGKEVPNCVPKKKDRDNDE